MVVCQGKRNIHLVMWLELPVAAVEDIMEKPHSQKTSSWEGWKEPSLTARYQDKWAGRTDLRRIIWHLGEARGLARLDPTSYKQMSK